MLDWLPALPRNGGDQFRMLADNLAAAIRAGRWQPGARLPTHRALSEHLGVSVSTVSRAYTELTRLGLIDSTVGRGSFVAGAPQGGEPDEDQDGRATWQRYQSMYLPLAGRRDIIDLSLNEPLEHPDSGLLSEGLDGLLDNSDLQMLARYQAPEGRPEHRAAAVQWLAEFGIDAAPRDIVIVPGGQGGLTTILLALCGRGDRVLTEDLTWPGILALASVLGLNLEPVEMDSDGLRPDAFEEACRTWRPRVLYTMPTLQNPTSTTAPAKRRAEIARIARAHNVMIIEDDAYGFLTKDAPPAYADISRDNTIYITSLSKSIAPAMRIGFVVAPRTLASRLSAVLRATAVMVSPLISELTTRMIASGAAFEAARFQATAAKRRMEIAAKLMSPAVVPETSFHIWQPLPDGWTTQEFVGEALAHGVAVTPGTAFSPSADRDPRGVRVCLCAEPDESRVANALQTLSDMLNAESLVRMPVV